MRQWSQVKSWGGRGHLIILVCHGVTAHFPDHKLKQRWMIPRRRHCCCRSLWQIRPITAAEAWKYMLESTSHLLLLGPDKLHFTDSAFHRGDGAPDRLEGLDSKVCQSCSVLPLRIHVFSPRGSFSPLLQRPPHLSPPESHISLSYTAEWDVVAN